MIKLLTAFLPVHSILGRVH